MNKMMRFHQIISLVVRYHNTTFHSLLARSDRTAVISQIELAQMDGIIPGSIPADDLADKFIEFFGLVSTLPPTHPKFQEFYNSCTQDELAESDQGFKDYLDRL